MLALAGIPATGGFVGKFYLIAATVSGGYTWLGVAIVVGSMISLAYYLPVVAAMWMRPPVREPLPAIAGGSGELDPADDPADSTAPASASGIQELNPAASPLARQQWEVTLVAVLAGATTLVLGIVPQPLFDLVRGVGGGLGLF
jgi:NADH-quinone oxidoreductase subunit N